LFFFPFSSSFFSNVSFSFFIFRLNYRHYCIHIRFRNTFF
jgi:hypothetical protein